MTRKILSFFNPLLIFALTMAILLAAVIAHGGAVKASPLDAQPPDVPDPLVIDSQSYASDFGVTVD